MARVEPDPYLRAKDMGMAKKGILPFVPGVKSLSLANNEELL